MLLQSLDLVPEREVVPIHLSRRRHRARAPIAPDGAGGVRIPADTQLTFDRYLSAFYESWWAEYTGLASYRLRLVAEGELTLTVHRQCGNGEVHLVERRHVEAGDATTVDVDLTVRPGGDVAPGRVWFAIDTTTDVALHAAAWETDDPPRRDVRLNAVVCTFNREDYLRQLLADIDADPVAVGAVEQLMVVNQGDRFGTDLGRSEWVSELESKLRVVEQPNFGGCGGFSRGLLETVRTPDLTHFLLLDDDIRIDPDSLARARSFLAFAHDDVALGGHMLDLDRPTALYEAGADIDQATLQPSPILPGLPLSDDRTLESFLSPRTCDYNGWWFFAGGSELLERHGLPMPCFIRGDDIEFGIRLAAEGSRTVAMPGIAVWHEPFYLKLGGWQLYFEVRNRLTMATIHDAGDWNAIRRSLAKVFVRDLLLSRYHSCTFLLDGIEDYLAGPERCFSTTPDSLHRCLAVQRELGPVPVESSLPTRRHQPGPRLGAGRKLAVRAAKAPRLGALLAKRLRAGPTAVDEQPFSPGSLRIADMASLASYVVREPDGSTWRYEWDSARERALFKRFVALMRELRPNPEIAAEAPRGPRAWFERWEQMFPEPVAEPAEAS